MNDFDFSFVADEKFRELLKRDFEELQICLAHKANKSVLILSGSIIETVLLEYFLHHKIISKTHAQILKLTLAELIDEAVSNGLLTQKTKDLSSVVRGYRNLIHPGKEVRSNEGFDYDTAVVSHSLVRIVIKEIRDNYELQYGYKAEEILNKIINDNSIESIFDQIIKKVGKYEINKLFDLMVNYWVDNRKQDDFTTQLKVRRFILKLKKIIDDKKTIEKITILTEQVAMGSEDKAISIFELVGSDLGKISEDDKNLILTYIYDAGGVTFSWQKNLLKFHNRFVYDYLGLYRDSEEMKQKFITLAINIVDGYHKNKDSIFFNAYEKLMSNFEADLLLRIEAFLIKKLDKDVTERFYKAYYARNELPF